MVAGVKDMRFQALMPDILHWLGITKIDNMVSMSDMKYDAIVKSGIPINKRYDIPGAFYFCCWDFFFFFFFFPRSHYLSWVKPSNLC